MDRFDIFSCACCMKQTHLDEHSTTVAAKEKRYLYMYTKAYNFTYGTIKLPVVGYRIFCVRVAYHLIGFWLRAYQENK